jgi:hypothetical protein
LQDTKYHVGDVVIVRQDLDINTVYQTFGGKNAGYRATPTLNMVRLAGSEFEIKEYSRSQKTVKLKCCGSYWTEQMLIPKSFVEQECVCESLL